MKKKLKYNAGNTLHAIKASWSLCNLHVFSLCEVKFCQIDFCKSKLDYTLWKKLRGNSNLNIFHICSYPHLWFLSFFTRSIQKLSFRCLFCFELMCLFLFMWHGFFYCCVLSKTNFIIFDCAFFFQYFIIIFFLNFLTKKRPSIGFEETVQQEKNWLD